ncbi:WXG100 family type VII secretion target [Amycolatopsis sp. NBC_00345]|uniref:WXG100 family type VII secretion target n=1 Tax=Amycolatopsis sp. NBC_00345 TaxID=2975955 RepID=UPI002E26410F
MSDEYHRGDVGNGSGISADDFKDPKNPGGGDSAGAGFFDTAFGLKKAVAEGDSLSIGMASVGMAVDILGMVLDPLGSLLTAGIGWLIEHLVIFRWPLDVLMGDPKGIDAAKEAIWAEGKTVKGLSDAHAKATQDVLKSWTGQAADTFRTDMEGVAAQLDALSDYVNLAGKQMAIAGGLIGTVRGIIRDLIAMTLAGILKAAIIAVALAPVTFGGSIIAAITSTIIEVGVAIGKIGTKIADLAKKLAEMLKLLAKTRGAADDVVKNTVGGNLGKIKVPPKTGPYTPKPPPDKPMIKENGEPGDKTPEGEGKPGDKDPTTPEGKKPEKVGDMVTRVVREKLEKELRKEVKTQNDQVEMDAALKNFDKWCGAPISLTSGNSKKALEGIEKIVKIMSDPTYGAQGMGGKIIVDMMKNIPPAATAKPEEEKAS